MQRLLLDLKTDGYPRDFLLARLRGRRQDWVKVGRKLADPWSAMQGELCWVYRTMDRKTREKFGLCFLYFELRRVLIALRRLDGHSREGLTQLGVQPLLNRELVRQLQGAAEVADAVRILDAALENEIGSLPSLEQILIEQGQRQMEELLVNIFFHHAVTQTRDPALSDYFSQLIDLHNLLLILKTRRWQLPDQQPLLAGGTETPQQWQSLLKAGHELRLQMAISRICGSEGVDAETVEHALLGRIQSKLHRQARAVPGPFLILSYLWAHYLHTRNLGLQLWAGDQLAAWERLG